MRLDDFAHQVAFKAVAKFRELGKVKFPSLDEAARAAVKHAAAPETQKAILGAEKETLSDA